MSRFSDWCSLRVYQCVLIPDFGILQDILLYIVIVSDVYLPVFALSQLQLSVRRSAHG